MSQENVEIIRRGYEHWAATRFAQLWTLRDGQRIRMQMYSSVDEALEAVGRSG